MKTTSKISICLVIVLLLSVLAACSADDKLEGTYCGSYTYDSNEYYVEITLNEDGTYKTVYEKNGQPDETYAGDYEIVDGKIRLYRTADHSTWNIYEYVDGHLENDSNNRIFNKK